MATLLVVTHAPTPATQRLREASVRIAQDADVFGTSVEVVTLDALSATAPEVFARADAYLFGTPVNFGYLSGALKHSFDCTYTALLGKVTGRPFSYWMHGRYDATGAVRAMEAITTGLELRQAAEPVVCIGDVTDADEEAAAELGGTLAALIS